ncbi:MAG: hypothetical protein ACD_23C01160G0002 [uncultured bacterium]|nr:MAG: hypothetical protein ACD_23C01160G0002 [uncultured bacterium]
MVPLCARATPLVKTEAAPTVMESKVFIISPIIYRLVWLARTSTAHPLFMLAMRCQIRRRAMAFIQ